ncbi:MAG: hypothetical protein ACR2IE_05480 [Candidatus Sumerlaeaceae bacterium]
MIRANIIAFRAVGILIFVTPVHVTHGQVVIVDPYLNSKGVISLGTLDAEISKARLEAAKTKEPGLEFEMVKLAIKDYVDEHRLNDYQTVRLAAPERFRSWVRDAAKRANRRPDDLLQEIVDTVAPNPIPDLTGDVYSSNHTYRRDRAMDNVQRNRTNAQGPEPPPIIGRSTRTDGDESAATASVDTSTPEPEPTSLRPPGNPDLIKVEFVEPATTDTRKQTGKTRRAR